MISLKTETVLILKKTIPHTRICYSERECCVAMFLWMLLLAGTCHAMHVDVTTRAGVS